MKKTDKSAKFGILGRIFRVKEWSDWERVGSGFSYLKYLFNKYFILQKKVVTHENFEEVIKKMGLSEEDLERKKNSLFKWSLVLLVLLFITLGYTFYQVFAGSLHAALLSLVIALLAGAMAFRYHFLHFQIKKRKLGCTFYEWFNYVFANSKN